METLKEGVDKITVRCMRKKPRKSCIRECLKFHSSKKILTSYEDWKKCLVKDAVDKYCA